MKIEKPEKIVGYALLVIGLFFIILSAWLAYSIFSSGTKIPQFVQMPPGGNGGFGEAFAIFSNVCLVFFILVIIMWAGSIISNRGIALIKEVKLKVTKESLGEVAEIVKEEKKRKA
jgi:uncharacterized membrane protein